MNSSGPSLSPGSTFQSADKTNMLDEVLGKKLKAGEIMVVNREEIRHLETGTTLGYTSEKISFQGVAGDIHAITKIEDSAARGATIVIRDSAVRKLLEEMHPQYLRRNR